MRKIVVFTGAGMSADSGIKTFRDTDGLWENHAVEDVATPEAWVRNPGLVLDFYNARRKQMHEVEPNKGHYALVELEKYFDVQIITQNVDNLHERAGSSHVLHLHGELGKVRSTRDPNLIYTPDHWEIKLGDVAEDGSQLRPHIVWFGEQVPMFETAIDITQTADIMIIVGTSLLVYPAASLIGYVAPDATVILIDPKAEPPSGRNIEIIRGTAAVELPVLIHKLITNENKKKYA
ncbi:MAG: NAD-dependent deacylase [Bacteroidales bacterium]|nr:NAD-dependent deacylase [Bacteroidales bacterium]